jgi:DNA repair exonuclease SbcCD ATPase subunit
MEAIKYDAYIQSFVSKLKKLPFMPYQGSPDKDMNILKQAIRERDVELRSLDEEVKTLQDNHRKEQEKEQKLQKTLSQFTDNVSSIPYFQKEKERISKKFRETQAKALYAKNEYENAQKKVEERMNVILNELFPVVE